jgi:hypothetical protein
VGVGELTQGNEEGIVMDDDKKEVVSVEDNKVLVDITEVVRQLKGGLEHYITSQARAALVKAIEKIVLDMAKNELRDIVGVTLREILDEMKFKSPAEAPPRTGKVLPVPSGARVELAAAELERKEPVYDLTLKEYLTLWMRGNSFSWGERPRIWEMVERHLQSVTSSIVKDELKMHTDQVQSYLQDNIVKEVLGAFMRRMSKNG